MGRNTLMNSQLKESFLWAATRKIKQNGERQKKHGIKNNTDESDFSENEIPDLNSLKPFEFEPKTNIGDINSSQKQLSRGVF